MEEETHIARTTILGIGNPLLTDEGAGIHAIRWLRERFDDAHQMEMDVRFIDGGTIGYALAGLIGESEQLIVIDAAQLGTEPGTVSTYTGEAMDAFLGEQRSLSAHEVSLLDMLVRRPARSAPSQKSRLNRCATRLNRVGARTH